MVKKILVDSLRVFARKYTNIHPQNFLIMIVPEYNFFETNNKSYTLLVSGKELDNIGELSSIKKIMTFIDFEDIVDEITSIVPVSTKDEGLINMLSRTIQVEPGSVAQIYDSQFNNVYIKEAIIFHAHYHD